MTGPLFRPEDGRWRPQPVARGPWDPQALHAGPVAALLARALESVPAAGPMQVVRMTLELFRPVPFVPLEVVATPVRDGRRIQYAEATLRAEGTELCRATAWRIRRADPPVVDPPPEAPPPPGPAGVDHPVEWIGRAGEENFGTVGTEQRWVEGDWHPGPAVVWFRLCVPVVADEPPSPVQRAMALADFGNGVSAAVPWATHTFVNTDLTVHLEREPAGEWIALRSSTRVDPAGTGLAESELFDARGRIGRAAQALYVDRR